MSATTDQTWDNASQAPPLVSSAGAPIGDMMASLSVGPQGPLLLQDAQLIDNIAHFTREKIPERVVHAQGFGVFGKFVVTNDISDICKAEMFRSVGKETRTFVRFSTTIGGSGSADTVRDFRGMAAKFYTEDGNFDLVMLSIPVFPINDPMKLPSLIHSLKQDPRSHMFDQNSMCDFVTLNPETLNAIFYFYSDSGIPDGYRHMNAYTCHAYKLVNKDGGFVYAKFQFKSDQGKKFLTPEEAKRLAGAKPDYAVSDLYRAIEKGSYPTWTLYIQTMTQEQAKSLGYYYSDTTKIWDEASFPLTPVGTLTLNEIPENYFEFTEQAAFAVRNLVPGVEGNQNKMFIARSFAYPDAQRARIGSNFAQLRVNCPIAPVKNYHRDGAMTYNNQGSAVNYYPNTSGGPAPDPLYKETPYHICAEVNRNQEEDADHCTQPRILYQSLSAAHKQRLACNLAGDVYLTRKDIQDRVIEIFSKVDPDFGDKLKTLMDELCASA
ncbi:catalase-like [Engystomops pustulosus]|uniref:catalase-like n=1 Tax=Engystomops pustulosus TaxID=76066 RepID=UPI003AFB4206